MINKDCYLCEDLDPQDGCTRYKNGTLAWYLNGLLHREDGPAIVSQQSQQWWKNGLLHREDGPAIIWPDGHGIWRMNGRRIGEMPSDFDWKKEGF